MPRLTAPDSDDCDFSAPDPAPTHLAVEEVDHVAVGDEAHLHLGGRLTDVNGQLAKHLSMGKTMEDVKYSGSSS